MNGAYASLGRAFERAGRRRARRVDHTGAAC